jgi:hypothetical protein
MGNYQPLVGVTLSQGTIGLWWEWPYQWGTIFLWWEWPYQRELLAFGGSDLISGELSAMVVVTLSERNYWPLVGVTLSEGTIGLWWEWPYQRGPLPKAGFSSVISIYLSDPNDPIDHSIHCQLYRYYLTSFTTTPPHRPLNTLSAIPWLPDIFYNDPTPWTTQYIVSYTVITWHIVGSDRYIEMTDEKPDFGRGLWEHFRLLTRFDPHQ